MGGGEECVSVGREFFFSFLALAWWATDMQYGNHQMSCWMSGAFFSSLFAFRDTQTNGGLFRSDSYMILPSLLPDCLDLMFSPNYCYGVSSLNLLCICVRRL
ncbi:hypothetical protein V8C43DRAFT_84123 [Trichoderma afarasin]